MTLTHPVWLLLLLLIPLAIAVAAMRERRARRYTVRYPALDSLRDAARGSGWNLVRHIPFALALLAIAAIAVAMTKPHERYKVALHQATIMLVTDHSGSMAADDVQPSRLAAAISAANTFIGKLPSGVKLGVVAFSTSPDAVQGPVTDHNAARQVIDNQQAGGGTATGSALTDALELLHSTSRRHPPSAIVLLSDGAADPGQDPVGIAQQAKAAHIPIDTVALGTASGIVSVGPYGQQEEVPSDPALMAQIAQASGGRTFTAQSADELSSIYKQLGSQLGSETRTREITPTFAIIALLLLLAAVAAGARFSGRLP